MMGLPDNHQGKPVRPVQKSGRENSLAAPRNPAPRDGGTQPGGRLKKWSCRITDAEGTDSPDVAQAACIRRQVSGICGDCVSKEYALILATRKARTMTASDVTWHVRSHWGIENKNTMSATPYTGKTTARPGPERPQTIASLHNLALRLFRLKTWTPSKRPQNRPAVTVHGYSSSWLPNVTSVTLGDLGMAWAIEPEFPYNSSWSQA
jgi:hypothetical protein